MTGDFTFLLSFPEFSNLTATARSRVSSLLRSSLQSLSSPAVVVPQFGGVPPVAGSAPDEWGADVDDPELWESCADACEALLERVTDGRDHGGGGKPNRGGREALVGASSLARQTAADKRRMMASQIKPDLDKSQKTYSFASQIDNGRLTPFVPRVSPLKPHGITPLSLAPVAGHGLDTIFTGPSVTDPSEELIAPKLHYPHPYTAELNALVHQPWQLSLPPPPPPARRPA